MDEWIAVTFRGRRKNKARLFVLGQAERVMGAKGAHFQRWNRQFEIIKRACRRGEMKNVIDFFFRQEDEIGNVVLDETIIRVSGQMPNVRGVARDQIVDRDHAMTFRQQTISQVRAQKASAAGYDRNGMRARGHKVCM